MLDLFDVERIEVLKGPQGVLFGKNNLAGTLNVITARPTDDFGGEVRLTAGSNGLKQVRGKINSGRFANDALAAKVRSEEHPSELQSLMRSSYAVFCLKKKSRTHATPSIPKPLIIYQHMH